MSDDNWIWSRQGSTKRPMYTGDGIYASTDDAFVAGRDFTWWESILWRVPFTRRFVARRLMNLSLLVVEDRPHPSGTAQPEEPA